MQHKTTGTPTRVRSIIFFKDGAGTKMLSYAGELAQAMQVLRDYAPDAKVTCSQCRDGNILDNRGAYYIESL